MTNEQNSVSTSDTVCVLILVILSVLKYVFNWRKYPWTVKFEPEKHAHTQESNCDTVFRVPPVEHYKDDPELRQSIFKRMNYPMVLYTGTLHWLSLCWLLNVLCGNDATKWQTYVWAMLIEVANKIGIGVGAHRLYAHRSYEAAASVRFVVMLFTSIANQDTLFHWVRDHRTHHLFSDTPADPHDSSRGFFFSHVGWLLLRKHSQLRAASRFVYVDDLKADPFIRLQQRFDPLWNMFWCFVFPAIVSLLWGETLFQGFLVAGALRHVYDLHTTWIVNSVVHKFGAKPYQRAPDQLNCQPERPPTVTVTSHVPISRENVTTEVPWVSLLSGGEGWHCWHHTFPWDYAAAEMECWQQFNSSKMIIDALAFFGLVSNRKRALEAWKIRKQIWLEEAVKQGKVSQLAYIKQSASGLAPFLVRTLEVVDPANVQPEAKPEKLKRKVHEQN